MLSRMIIILHDSAAVRDIETRLATTMDASNARMIAGCYLGSDRSEPVETHAQSVKREEMIYDPVNASNMHGSCPEWQDTPCCCEAEPYIVDILGAGGGCGSGYDVSRTPELNHNSATSTTGVPLATRNGAEHVKQLSAQ